MAVIACDVGTANLIVAHKEGNETKTSLMRDCFFEIPPTDFNKRMLEKLKVAEFELNGKLYVAGNEAFDLAQTFGKSLRRPMSSGVISPGEAEAIPMITRMIERLLRDAGAVPGDVCSYNVPGEPVGADFDTVFHRTIIEGILKKNLLVPKSIQEGHSVVLSELGADDFTGIGLSAGGGMLNCCVSYMGVPVISFSSVNAGDWVDLCASKVCGETAPRMTAIKESPDFDLNAPKTREHSALASYYEAMITNAVTNMATKFNQDKSMPRFKSPVVLAAAGGTSMAKGFIDMFKRIYDKVGFPIPVKEIRLAEDPLYAIVRGTLIYGEL